jgi:hypothetical protein
VASGACDRVVGVGALEQHDAVGIERRLERGRDDHHFGVVGVELIADRVSELLC